MRSGYRDIEVRQAHLSLCAVTLRGYFCTLYKQIIGRFFVFAEITLSFQL